MPRKNEKLKKIIADQARPDFLVPGVPSGLGPPQRSLLGPKIENLHGDTAKLQKFFSDF